MKNFLKRIGIPIYLIILALTSLGICILTIVLNSVHSMEIITLVGVVLTFVTLCFYSSQKNDSERDSHFQTLLNEVNAAFSSEGLRHPVFREEELNPINGCQIYKNTIDGKEEACNEFVLKERLTLYDYFYEYILAHMGNFKESQMNREQVRSLYSKFACNLQQRDQLDKTYRVLYHCFHFVIESTWSDKEKRERIELISNHLTSKQLICYFFNQIHFEDRTQCPNGHLEDLRHFSFFNTMFQSQEYKDIQRVIPQHVEEKLYSR